MQVELLFRLTAIVNEQSKFDHAISGVTSETAFEVRDIIACPGTTTYTTLKQGLIETTSESQSKCLVKAIELTDQ